MKVMINKVANRYIYGSRILPSRAYAFVIVMSRIVPPMLLRALGRGVVGVVVGAESAIGLDNAGWTSSFFSTAGVAQVGTDHWDPVNDFS